MRKAIQAVTRPILLVFGILFNIATMMAVLLIVAINWGTL